MVSAELFEVASRAQQLEDKLSRVEAENVRLGQLLAAVAIETVSRTTVDFQYAHVVVSAKTIDRVRAQWGDKLGDYVIDELPGYTAFRAQLPREPAEWEKRWSKTTKPEEPSCETEPAEQEHPLAERRRKSLQAKLDEVREQREWMRQVLERVKTGLTGYMPQPWPYDKKSLRLDVDNVLRLCPVEDDEESENMEAPCAPKQFAMIDPDELAKLHSNCNQFYRLLKKSWSLSGAQLSPIEVSALNREVQKAIDDFERELDRELEGTKAGV